MCPAVAAAVSIGGFVATLALLLLTPLGDEFVVSAAVLVGLYRGGRYIWRQQLTF